MKDLHILLADDDKDDCLFFQEALEELQLNTQLTTVHNGDELIQLLQKSYNSLPDILFLDLNMPRKNGFSCLEEIKSNECLKRLPVVIYSTSFNETMVDMLYSIGAHYYICKPGDFPSLKKLIQQAITLTLKESHAQPSREYFLLGHLRTMLW